MDNKEKKESVNIKIWNEKAFQEFSKAMINVNDNIGGIKNYLRRTKGHKMVINESDNFSENGNVVVTLIGDNLHINSVVIPELHVSYSDVEGRRIDDVLGELKNSLFKERVVSRKDKTKKMVLNLKIYDSEDNNANISDEISIKILSNDLSYLQESMYKVQEWYKGIKEYSPPIYVPLEEENPNTECKK
jgi:molybdopterin converting factor small subunit